MDGNETPYGFAPIATYAASDEEGGVTWSLTGTDSGDFDIVESGGAVTFKNTPSFEAPADSNRDNVYNFTVVATDVESGSPRLTDEVDVTVTVEDVEEDGTLSVSNLNPGVGDPVTFTLTDPDGGIDLTPPMPGEPPSFDWDIELRTPGGVWQEIDVSLPLSTTFTYTVVEDDTGEELRASVTYKDQRGSGKNATSVGTAVITADPIINAPPRFTGEGTGQSIPEGEAGRFLNDRLTASDRDGDTLTFGIGDGVNSHFFEVNPSTGQIEVIEALDFETTPLNGLLTVPVTLHDGKDADGNVETDPADDDTTTMSIFITDMEEDGVVTLSQEEPEVGVALTATLTDGDGNVSGDSWQWTRSENGVSGWDPIPGATSSTYTPVDADGDFFLRARVEYTDRRGAGKDAEGVTDGPVPSENRRPLFPSTETGQRTVPENTRAGLSIGAPVAAVDPENNRLTYSLSGTDAAAFTIVTSTGQLRLATGVTVDFETKSTYRVNVEVHDGRDGSGNTSTTIDDTQAVTVTIENVEEPGTVTLTTDTATIQARVPVTATLEDDDGPFGITWQWSRSPNGSDGWVNIATSATYTPTLEDDAGKYIRATASYTDGHGRNKTANAVSPRVGDPPPVNSEPAFPSTENGQREVPEDATGGASIGAPVEATDLNAGDSVVNDPLAYSLTGTDAASFTIDGSTGQLRVASGVTLDFETKRSHRFTVQVTDGADQHGDDDMDAIDDTITVTVTVTNVNEAPVVTGDDAPSFQEGSTSAVATYTGTDPERDTLTWSVSGNDFWISSRGQLYFSTPPSFEAQTTYSVTVTATDDDENGNLSGSLAVTVTVTDAEEQGTITIEPLRGWDGTTFQAGLDDDDGGITGETWQWERSSNRSRWEDISGAASSAYTATSADENQYLRVTVTYTDRRSSGKEASARVTGRIEDSTDRPLSNNAPAFTETAPTRSVGQGTAAGRNVGAPARATDADQGDVLTYSLQSGTDADAFDIDAATGQIRTKDVLDNGVKDTYTVTVNVHDGFGPSYNPNPQVDATIDVTITVTPPRPPPPPPPPPITGGGGGGGAGGVAPLNRSPSFIDGAATSRSVAENAVVGQYIGVPVVARDPDGDALTYTLSGADPQFFDVHPTTGQLRVNVPLDYETRSSYSVVVRVADGRGGRGLHRSDDRGAQRGVGWFGWPV